MKQTFLIGMAAILFATSCSNNPEAVESSDSKEVTTASEGATTFTVNAETSSIQWLGTKKLGKSHNGTINISSGELAIENGMIISGNFTIDMTTIKNEDLPVDGDYNQAALEGHLKSGDFFNADSFPTASFEITSVNVKEDESGNTHVIAGNLTIKGISKNIEFPAKVMASESGVTANATVVFNRLDWNVNFDKNAVDGLIDQATKKIKDDFVSNEIQLTISLVAGL